MANASIFLATICWTAHLLRPSVATVPARTTSGGGSIRLQGVMAVGSQVQALVRTAEGSGAICVGPAGRCGGDDTKLLPKEWTVRSIDLQRGCFTYTVEGKAQKPVCIDDEADEEAKV